MTSSITGSKRTKSTLVKEKITSSFRKGSFIRNITIFTGGSFIAYGIGILFTPFITRIYTPEVYGALAFFNTSLALALGVSTLNYNECLILPEKRKDFYALGQLMLIVALFLGSLITVFLLFFRDWLLSYFNVEPLGNLIFLLPVILIMGIFQKVAENHNIREKSFSTIASARIVSITSAKSLVLSIGYWAGSVVWGLISGEVFIRLVNTLAMIRNNWRSFWVSMFSFNMERIRENGMKYKEYPLLIFPASMLNQLTLHLPVYVIGRIYSNAILGFYALANSLISLPIQIIGFSMGKVFLQKLKELHSEKNEPLLKQQFVRFHYGLVLVSSLIYGMVYLLGPNIFEIFAGENWRTSGEIAAIMSPALVFQLVSLPISPVFRIFRKEKYQFFANLAGSLLILFGLMAAIFLSDLPSNGFFYLLAALIAVKEWIVMLLVFSCVRINLLRHFITTILVVGAVFGFFHLLKILIF